MKDYTVATREFISAGKTELSKVDRERVGEKGYRVDSEMHFRSLRCWQTVTLNTVEDTLLKIDMISTYIKEKKKRIRN